MKLGAVAAVAVLGVVMSGCASIIKGTSQSIVITTPPVSGANCVLTRNGLRWSVQTPGTVRVSKSRDDILIQCSAPGYRPADSAIPSDFQVWTLGNVILGGLIGITVDAADGAMNEYPRQFSLPMSPGYVPTYKPQTQNYSPPSASEALSSPSS